MHRATDRWMEMGGTFGFARCAACRQVYLRERPPQDDLARYYPPGYIRRGRAPEALRRWMRRRDQAPRVRLAAAQPGRRLLDVGCATGEFLAAMRAVGWVVAGVEPAPWAVAEASAKGLPVWPTTVGTAALPPAAFDVATLWDVIEHLAAPRQDLKAIARSLRPSGRLIATTPVLDGWEARLYGDRWPGWDAPRHLLIFERDTLASLLRSCGFHPVAWTWISESYLITAMHLGLLARERLPRPVASAAWSAVHARPVRLAAAPVFRRLDRWAGGCWLTVVAEKDG
jgi:2-polyprenyl-3-methyl-5-hydroxy-6-metoxy-1,4-benzoquinol methylase